MSRRNSGFWSHVFTLELFEKGQKILVCWKEERRGGCEMPFIPYAVAGCSKLDR